MKPFRCLPHAIEEWLVQGLSLLAIWPDFRQLASVAMFKRVKRLLRGRQCGELMSERRAGLARSLQALLARLVQKKDRAELRLWGLNRWGVLVVREVGVHTARWGKVGMVLLMLCMRVVLEHWLRRRALCRWWGVKSWLVGVAVLTQPLVFVTL